jgi:bifunctional non-homologous end joining protein LigD
LRSVLDSLTPDERRLLRRSSQPRQFEPMKATLSRAPFDDPDWIFERKLDGVRCLAYRDGERVRLLSRTAHELGRSYPELVEAIGAEACSDFVVDGEIVAFDGRVTSFARLQRRMQLSDPEAARRTGVEVFLYAFDLVHLDGHDTRQLPLRSRKALLRRGLSFDGPVRYVTHRNGAGKASFTDACARGLEGIIGKRADSGYRSARSRDWLKFKCIAEQELVIGGFTAPKGSRTDFGALLVGYYDDGRLRYAGKVGTGFDQATLRELGLRLRKLERSDPPFADEVKPRPPGLRWVRPDLVAQIAFAEWTRDGRLRQPRYLGLRNDKPAKQVVRERPS